MTLTHGSNSEAFWVLASSVTHSRTRTMRLEERQDEEKQFGSCGND